jgi:hypothetical protein
MSRIAQSNVQPLVLQVKSGVIMMEDGQVVEKMNTMEVKAAMKNMHIRMRYEQNQEVKD